MILNRAFKRLPTSHFAAGALVLALLFAGALEPFERWLLEFRFERIQRPASDQLVVVEIGAKSLHDLDTWPWPRAYHAEVIERLIQAGARQIALDIDFSARSTPADDQAFRRAVQNAGNRLILPTFVQGKEALSSTPAFENAPNRAIGVPTRLGLANVRAEVDGRIWRYPVSDDLPSGFRPSLAVALAGAGHFQAREFIIDYGVRADTITRVAYVDVLRGRVDPEVFKGRDVLVGSTAAELGDHLGVPVYRAMPGVLIHALAYESIVQGRMIQRTSRATTALGVFLLLFLLAPLMATDETRWPWALAAGLLAAAAIVGGTVAVQNRFPVAVDSAAWLATLLAMFLAGIIRRLHQQAILLFRQRMAQTHGRALMRAVVEDSFDGVIIAGATGRIELANRAALRILGRSSPLVGVPCEEILPGIKDLPHAAAAESDAAAPKHEMQLRREDGSDISIEVVAGTSELRVSRRRYERRKTARRVSIYTFRDVTERRQMHAAQRDALRAAQLASRAKSEFVANMSHELRTPLNAIIGFSEAILAEVFGQLGNPRYHTYIRDIHGSGTHLLAIIQQVLDVSRIEAGTMRLNEERVSLPTLLRDCERIIRGWLATSHRELAVSVEGDVPSIIADPVLVKQIVLNLLSNAVKFTRVNGAIGVRVYVDGEGCPAMEVTDDGVGIPRDKIAQLGQAFFQADASIAGTGLGLYLTRQFVDLHGATLAFESEPGKGTRVRVTFPRSRVAGPADSNDQRSPDLSPPPAHGHPGSAYRMTPRPSLSAARVLGE